AAAGPRAVRRPRQSELDERQRPRHVDLVDLAQLVQRVLGEWKEWARTEHACVVDDEVDGVPRGFDECGAMTRVGDVAGDGDDVVVSGPSALELGPSARIDDEAPAPFGQRTCEREAQASRGAGDDSNGHAPNRRALAVPVGIGNWS